MDLLSKFAIEIAFHLKVKDGKCWINPRQHKKIRFHFKDKDVVYNIKDIIEEAGLIE